MFAELALATAMVTLTVAIHAVGLCSVSRLLRLEESDEAQEKVYALSLRGIYATIKTTAKIALMMKATEVTIAAYCWVWPRFRIGMAPSGGPRNS